MTELSSFLAVSTMLGVILLEGYKLLFDPVSNQVLQENWMALLVGNVAAFVVVLPAIRFFIDYVTHYGFKFFGYHHTVIGLLILIPLLCGVPLAAH